MPANMYPIGRVAAGSYPPAAPTDPDVPNSGIRLLKLCLRCNTHVAILRRCVLMASWPNVPAICPSASSTARSAASLHRVPSGQVPRLHRYYRPTPTSRLPSHLASSPSLGTTTACAPLRSHGAGRAPRGPGPFLTAAPAPPLHGGETRPPRFLDDPCVHAPLFDPSGAPAPGPFGTGDGVFRHANGVDSAKMIFRGSITRPARSLCTLHSRGHPRTAQHSVPAGGQPWPVRSLTCWVA